MWKPQQQPQPVQRLRVSIWNQFHSISRTINYITTASWLPLLSDPHQWAVFVWPSLLSFPNEGNCFNPLMRHRGEHVHVSRFEIKNMYLTIIRFLVRGAHLSTNPISDTYEKKNGFVNYNNDIRILSHNYGMKSQNSDTKRYHNFWLFILSSTL